MRDAFFWSQASSLWRWIICSEGSAAGGCTQRRGLCSKHGASTGKVEGSRQPAVVQRMEHFIVRTHKITFAPPPRLCAHPAGMEEAVVCSSQRSSDGRPGRVGVLQKWQCQEADTRDRSQLVRAGTASGVKHNRECRVRVYERDTVLCDLTPSLLPFPGGCGAVVQQEGLGAQLHIRHQDHRPRLLPGRRLRRRDEQVGPLHLRHLRLQPHRRR